MGLELTMYTRSACHLCEEMLEALEGLRDRYDFDLRCIDIDGDLALIERCGTRVPVRALGDAEICEYFLDEEALARAIEPSLRDAGLYTRIYALVSEIPPGRVATYGQIAALEGHCAPRNVGYAMSALPSDRDVPWQRVINSAGRISERRGGGGTDPQRVLLESEGVVFDRRGRVDFARYAWAGPDWEWMEHHGFYPAPPPGAAEP